jgi:hypothetical protein
MRISRHDLRRRYSNSLVIDAGSQFNLRACSQATSTLLSNTLAFAETCSRVVELAEVIPDFYTYPEMAKRIFFLAKQIRPLLPTMSDSLFTWRGGGWGGGVWPLHYQRFCAHCMQYAFINEVCTSNTLQKHKLILKVFKSQVCLGEMTPL